MNRETLSKIIDQHCSGWIDNGKPTVRCMCDYRPKRLGERHSDHVADDIIAKLGVPQ